MVADLLWALIKPTYSKRLKQNSTIAYIEWKTNFLFPWRPSFPFPFSWIALQRTRSIILWWNRFRRGIQRQDSITQRFRTIATQLHGALQNSRAALPQCKSTSVEQSKKHKPTSANAVIEQINLHDMIMIRRGRGEDTPRRLQRNMNMSTLGWKTLSR